MKQNRLWLSLLPGFAPIVIYIAVEAIAGETAGLAAGIALGLGEFVWILIRERRADAFSLVDTVLLVLMGALSWLLADPVFFRLKPAISGAVLSLLMLVGTLGPRRLFLPYLESKIGGGELSEAVTHRLLTMIAGFGALTLAHSALTAVAALWWSKAAWNFVAGILFWILAALYMAAWTVPSLLTLRAARRGTAPTAPNAKLRDNAEGVTSAKSADNAEGAAEILPVVDERGAVIGKAPRPLCHRPLTPSEAPAGLGPKLLHPVVRLWLSDGKGGFWMQRRAAGKLVEPGKWDCAVGGHISFGETAALALEREAGEEIGLRPLPAVRERGAFIWETELERELVLVFDALAPEAGFANQSDFHADPAEVSDVRRWSADELRRELEKAPSDSSLAPLARADLARAELARAELAKVKHAPGDEATRNGQK